MLYFDKQVQCSLYKNPITLVNDEACAFSSVNMPPNLVTLNMNKMSYSVWRLETDIDRH